MDPKRKHLFRQPHKSITKQQVHIQMSKISLILQSYGLTQLDLARKTDLSVGTVNHLIKCLESGELQGKHLKRNLRLLSMALNINPELLMGQVFLVLVVSDKNQSTPCC
jgi:hypothetical protein